MAWLQPQPARERPDTFMQLESSFAISRTLVRTRRTFLLSTCEVRLKLDFCFLILRITMSVCEEFLPKDFRRRFVPQAFSRRIVEAMKDECEVSIIEGERIKVSGGANLLMSPSEALILLAKPAALANRAFHAVQHYPVNRAHSEPDEKRCSTRSLRQQAHSQNASLRR